MNLMALICKNEPRYAKVETEPCHLPNHSDNDDTPEPISAVG